MAFVPFILSRFVDPCFARSDIFYPYPPHLRSGPCNIQSHAVPPKPPSLCTYPICTPQSYSHVHTHTYYTVYTHASILFCIHTFLLYHSLVIHLDLCSILYSRFVPIALPYFYLSLLHLLSYCLSFHSSLLLLWSLARSVLSLLSLSTSSRHYLLSGIATIWNI